MSAFMVEDTTINCVVTWITRAIATPPTFYLDQLARKYAIDLVSDGWDEKLAYAMFQLNCDGVNARYGAGEAEKFRPRHFVYKPEYTSLVQVFKSLQCWHYQCCEGEVSKTKLYQFFKEVEEYLAVKIVEDLPEYDRAAWS
jgi:hypothetical protein